MFGWVMEGPYVFSLVTGAGVANECGTLGVALAQCLRLPVRQAVRGPVR
jgi:hypothetical protein